MKHLDKARSRLSNQPIFPVTMANDNDNAGIEIKLVNMPDEVKVVTIMAVVIQA